MREMLLCDCQLGKDYVIDKLLTNNKITSHLENLGFVKKEKIKLLKHNYKNKSILVKVCGINYALDIEIAKQVVVIN